MLGAGDVAGGPLVVLADVEQVDLALPCAEIVRVRDHILRENDDVDRSRPEALRMSGIEAPYPTTLVPLLPEFLNRRRAGFTYPLRVMEELGLDRPAFAFVVGGVALQPEEGAHLSDIFNPYATRFDQWLAPAAAARAAGLVDEAGGRWRATAKGRELAARVRREADAYLATLAPIPPADLARLASSLQRAFAAIASSDVPHDHIGRVARSVGDARVPMVALENAVFALWQARDDCHMSVWRDAAFDGPGFDVFTRLWRHQATTEDELLARLAQQRPDDVREAIARLRADGLVGAHTLQVTERGASARQRIEEETDRCFFAPWPDDVAREAAWIESALREINARLAPVP